MKLPPKRPLRPLRFLPLSVKFSARREPIRSFQPLILPRGSACARICRLNIYLYLYHCSIAIGGRYELVADRTPSEPQVLLRAQRLPFQPG